MATAIWRNASHFRNFHRCLYTHALSQCRSSVPSSPPIVDSLHRPSLPLMQTVRFPPHFLLLLSKTTNYILSIYDKCLFFFDLHRSFLLKLNSIPYELVEDIYLILPLLLLIIKRNHHHQKPILKEPKTLEVPNRTVVMQANLFVAGYFLLLFNCSVSEFSIFLDKKFRIFCWLDWHLQPVSWLSFLLLLATGIGIILYYDKNKKRHIEGTLLWWVVFYVLRFCTLERTHNNGKLKSFKSCNLWVRAS